MTNLAASLSWLQLCHGCHIIHDSWLWAVSTVLFKLHLGTVPIKRSAHAVGHLGGFMLRSCWCLPSLTVPCPCLEADPYLVHQSCTSSFSGRLCIWGDNQLDLFFINLQGFHHPAQRKVIWFILVLAYLCASDKFTYKALSSTWEVQHALKDFPDHKHHPSFSITSQLFLSMLTTQAVSRDSPLFLHIVFPWCWIIHCALPSFHISPFFNLLCDRYTWYVIKGNFSISRNGVIP